MSNKLEEKKREAIERIKRMDGEGVRSISAFIAGMEVMKKSEDQQTA